MVNPTVKRLATGLVLSGLLYTAPALAQSALAQQSIGQQSSKTSTTTAKPAGSKSTSPATKSSTAAKKSPPKPLVYVEDNRSPKPADTSAGKTGDASASKTANASASKNSAAPASKGTSASNGSATSAKKPSGNSASQKPLSADLTKAFAQNCPSVALTESKTKAAYDVTFEHEPGSKGVKTGFGLTNAVHKTSRIEVMNKSGKELFSETGHSTGQLVKDACTAIGTPSVKVAKN